VTRSKWTMGLLLGLLLGSPPAHGQTKNLGDFISDPKSGCKVWDPHPLVGETASWSGDCVQGFAQGPGNVLWSRDGKAFEKDEGSWDQGRQSGRGSQNWGSGRYEGEFRNGKPNGEGTATNLHGVYEGRWKDGCLRQGEKTITFAVPSSSCR